MGEKQNKRNDFRREKEEGGFNLVVTRGYYKIKTQHDPLPDQTFRVDRGKKRRKNLKIDEK